LYPRRIFHQGLYETSFNKGTLETNRRSKRGVMLTEKEFKFLQEGSMDTKSRSKLQEKLDEKFPKILDEIELMSSSEVLLPWREIKRKQLGFQFRQLGNLFLWLSDKKRFKKTYLDLIVTSKKGEETVYYMVDAKNIEKDQKNFYYSDRMFQETNVLRGIKARPELKKWLLRGYKKKKIPQDKKNALTIMKLKRRLKKK